MLTRIAGLEKRSSMEKPQVDVLKDFGSITPHGNEFYAARLFVSSSGKATEVPLGKMLTKSPQAVLVLEVEVGRSHADP
jgi:hypothetical protein